MKRLLPLLMFATLAGCADRVKDAREELTAIKKAGGSKSELCRAERKIEAAMLEAHDQGYSEQKLHADVACLTLK